MIERVIKFVEREPPIEAMVERPDRVVASIKVLGESAKHHDDPELGFAIAEVTGGIEDHRSAVGEKTNIARPEIAVEQRWLRFVAFKQFVQVVDEPVCATELSAVAAGELELKSQPVFAPEIDPVVVSRIALRCAADRVVPVPAEIGLLNAMEFGQLPPELFLTGGCWHS